MHLTATEPGSHEPGSQWYKRVTCTLSVRAPTRCYSMFGCPVTPQRNTCRYWLCLAAPQPPACAHIYPFRPRSSPTHITASRSRVDPPPTPARCHHLHALRWLPAAPWPVHRPPDHLPLLLLLGLLSVPRPRPRPRSRAACSTSPARLLALDLCGHCSGSWPAGCTCNPCAVGLGAVEDVAVVSSTGRGAPPRGRLLTRRVCGHDAVDASTDSGCDGSSGSGSSSGRGWEGGSGRRPTLAGGWCGRSGRDSAVGAASGWRRRMRPLPEVGSAA